MTDTPAPEPASPVDTTVPQSARIWNYWLGGKDHYAVDQEVGDQIRALFPGIVLTARADRAFLSRVVGHLAGERGVRQFLDIGTGLPTMDNTHEVAQRIAPESRIVYVDNDPLVLLHAQALLTSSPEGACAYIDADLNDPDTIVRKAAQTLDLSRPVALMLLGIVHFLLDDARAEAIIRRLLDAVPSGSYLAISHACDDVQAAEVHANVDHWNRHGTPKMTIRSSQQIARFFDGLELLEPGVVSYTRWRPEETPFGLPGEVPGFCGVGRKP